MDVVLNFGPSDGLAARIRVGSSPPIVAEVTTGSVERLALAAGAEVWASFKAVEGLLQTAVAPE